MVVCLGFEPTLFSHRPNQNQGVVVCLDLPPKYLHLRGNNFQCKNHQPHKQQVCPQTFCPKEKKWSWHNQELPLLLFFLRE